MSDHILISDSIKDIIDLKSLEVVKNDLNPIECLTIDFDHKNEIKFTIKKFTNKKIFCRFDMQNFKNFITLFNVEERFVNINIFNFVYKTIKIKNLDIKNIEIIDDNFINITIYIYKNNK